MTKLDPRVEIVFADQPPQKTCWLEIEVPVDNEPVELLAALGAAGWQDQTVSGLPGPQNMTWPPKSRWATSTRVISFLNPGPASFALGAQRKPRLI